MKIRNKLTLLFTSIIAFILLLFAASIYYAYATSREEEYYKQIKQQALTKTRLLLDVAIDPEILKLIYKNAPDALFQEEVAVYDKNFTLIYHDDIAGDFVKETHHMLREISAQEEIAFMQDNRQVVGLVYRKNGEQFIITAAAYDVNGLARLENLKYTMIIAYLVSILLVFGAGRFLSAQALRPISRVIRQVGDITAFNLHLRVDEGNGSDEMAELAITFNEMLMRLENSFEAQRQFVSNISHELRTPLSAMMAELEIAISRERNTAEYRHTIQQALHDARKLSKLSNGLLDMAKASYDASSITFKTVRLDEILLDAQMEVQKTHPAYQVTIAFDTDLEDERSVTATGNAYLLKTAFYNLMENACKFSPDKQCQVTIDFDAHDTLLKFADRGVGIDTEDLPHIFKAFYRGANKDYAEGNGIGLSLTHKIIGLHKGEIQVCAAEKQGSIFSIRLSHH